MDLIGKTTINPVLFYTGKISGYITWIIYVLTTYRYLSPGIGGRILQVTDNI